jgi:subtilisin family serine protease
MKINSSLRRFSILCIIACMLLANLVVSQPGQASQSDSAYIEPGLLSMQGEGQVSIILTAGSSQAAARAVRRVGGQVTSELWLIDAVAAIIPASSIRQASELPGVISLIINHVIQAADEPISSILPIAANPVDPDDTGWVTDYRFPVPWDGSPDVIYDKEQNSFRIAYPLRIDTGADQIMNVSGTGVTIAVVDSGVYFDPIVSEWLDLTIRNQFLGQIDFVDPECTVFPGWSVDGYSKDAYSIGVQQYDYCFMDYTYSRDPYGHGSHVAGIVWNQLQDETTGVAMGIAPAANILSVRVLGSDGSGSYERVIQGIQFVLEHQAEYNIRVLNLSLSALQTVPYFMDPLNRAVEKAWQAGLVVVAAAGNNGPSAETITVPGNDPYVITVGALDGRRTPGYWKDDIVPVWSSSGPTLDGFIKPDILAPGAQVVSFMHNSFLPEWRAHLVSVHPDYSLTSSLFRMNGTSMATAVTSGVVALMLEANPSLTPDQVKYRLMTTARQMDGADGQVAVSPLQQGAGRLWAPDAVNAALADGYANTGMDLQADLEAGWGTFDQNGLPVLDFSQLSKHYLGPVRKALSDDGRYYLYFASNLEGQAVALGVSEAQTNQWLLLEQVDPNTTWTSGKLVWSGGADLFWSANGLSWYSGTLYDGSGKLIWSGGMLVWSGNGLYDAAGKLVWSGSDLFNAAGKLVWSGGKLVWSGSTYLTWKSSGVQVNSGKLFDATGKLIWSGGKLIWSGSCILTTTGALLWSGGDLFTATGKLVWSGSKLVWSGGKLIWSGGKLVWSGGKLISSSGAIYDPVTYDDSLAFENNTWSSGKLVWSGGKLIWSGGKLVWSGSNPVWEAGKLVWSGGKLIWSGATDWATPIATSSANLTATRWIDWR